MGTHSLKHTFQPSFAGNGKLFSGTNSVLRLAPTLIDFEITFEDGSDQDNKALRDDLDDGFGRVVALAERWYVRDIGKLFAEAVKLMSIYQFNSRIAIYAGTLEKNINVLAQKFNAKIDGAFSNWLKAVETLINGIVEKWNNKRNASRWVKTKRGGGAAGNVASTAWAASTVLVRPDKAIKIGKNCKKLYDKCHSAATSTQTKRVYAEKMLQDLIALCKVIGKTSEQNWTQYIQIGAKELVSVTSDLSTAIDEYENSVIVMEGREKGLGTEIRKLIAKGKADRLQIDEELRKLSEMHEKIRDHLKSILNFKYDRDALVLKHDLLTMGEKAARVKAKHMATAAEAASKLLWGDASDLLAIKNSNFVAAYKTLDNGLKARMHTVRLKV